MSMHRHPFLFFSLLLLLCKEPGLAFGINVRFYEKPNSTGFYVDVDKFEGNCAQVDRQIRGVKGSIRTDTCLMINIGYYCEDYSTKVLPGTHDITPELFNIPQRMMNGHPYWSIGINSFRPCTMTEGGPELNVDMLFPSRPVYQFKNLCGCRNLPKLFFDKEEDISADNHGNAFRVYSERNCPVYTGLNKVVPAGNNPSTKDLTNFRMDRDPPIRLPIKSIGPETQSFSVRSKCAKLTSTVFRFEFFDEVDEDYVKKESVEIGAKTVFKNDGPGKLVQEYKVSKTVTETAELTLAEGLTDMHHVTVENTATAGGGAEIPFMAKGAVHLALKTAYEYTRTSSSSETTRHVSTTTRDFTIRQQIEVPGCTEYTVSSTVSMLKDKPISYKVLSKVTGDFGGARMTANEIKEYLSNNLEVIENFDRYTVVVEAWAEMKASYGAQAVFNGKGRKLPECEAKG